MATRRGFVTQPKSKSKTIELVTKTIVLSNETAPKELKIEATPLIIYKGDSWSLSKTHQRN